MVPPHGLQKLKVAPYQFLRVRFTQLKLPVNPRCVPFEPKCVPNVSTTDRGSMGHTTPSGYL